MQWAGCEPDERQRIYFANHSSHLDFVVLWSALPSEIRAKTRPIAAKDYWEANPVTSLLGKQCFPRNVPLSVAGQANQLITEEHHFVGRHLMDAMADALGTENSLILFPEGTRGSGEKVGPFRSGLYHLAVRRPDVELVPAYLENLNRILPKGEFFPVPMLSLLTFGQAHVPGPRRRQRRFPRTCSGSGLPSLRRIGVGVMFEFLHDAKLDWALRRRSFPACCSRR